MSNQLKSVKKNNEFDFVYNNGISTADKYFVLYIIENGLKVNRLGVSISKKTGNSVVRHRYKRLIKENFYKLEHHLKIGFDFVVIVRKDAVVLDFKGVGNSIIVLLRKLSNKKQVLI